MLERIARTPTTVPLVDLILHRHCLDCGLAIVRHTPLGMVYDLGTTHPHACPADPGQLTTCLCGKPVRALMSGRVMDLASGEAHDCEWSEDLGLRMALCPPPAKHRDALPTPERPARQTVEIPD
jgi:hypothetical protein